MCGIFGSIGKSKDPKVSFDLLQSLFLRTEVRGTDASGFYCTEPEDGPVLYDKEPIKSSEYTKREIWTKTFANTDVDMFIGHCRQTSANVGTEKVNKNNHPHLSEDRRVAMVHNGKIPEFSALKNRYDVGSECDSEILLRMFESAQTFKDKEEELKKEFPTLTPFLAYRIAGLKEIFSRVNYGAMAVAIAERGDDGSRYLWLFRDDERPLHVVDMRKTLGQIFFCSTADIWRNAVESTPSAKTFIPQDQVIIEFPSYQIWLLALDKNETSATKPWHIRKFKISKTKYIDWKQEDEEDEKLSFKKSSTAKPKLPPMKIVTRLQNNDELVQPKIEEPPLALPVAAKDTGKKKVSTTTVDLGKSGVSAQVKVDGRTPGDESEHEDSETWINGDENGQTGPPFTSPMLAPGTTETILTKEELESNTVDSDTLFPIMEGIDLDIFDKKLDQIEKNLKAMKAKVHTSAKANQLSNREYSQVLDIMETIDQEAMQALNTLQSNGS